MSRLLNATDGLLGQDTRFLVLITTNEPVGRLHPAIARPGRCLAEVEFSHLSSEEANEWLEERCDERVNQARTVADLFELASGRHTEHSRQLDRPMVGFAAR